MLKKIIVLGIAIISCIILTVLSHGCDDDYQRVVIITTIGNSAATLETEGYSTGISYSVTLIGELEKLPESDYYASVNFYWALDRSILADAYEGSGPASASPTGNPTPRIDMTENGQFSTNLSGLAANTRYYYRAFATVNMDMGESYANVENVYGHIRSFRTPIAVVGEQEEEGEEEPAGEQEEEEEYYTLTISSSENGSVVNLSEGSHTYEEDVVVNLVAVADEGYQFDRWEGDVTDPESASTTIVMNADKSVTAYFEAIPPFEVTSGAFSDGERMPSIYSYEGGNRSPPLEWTGVPHGTESFVLMMYDPDSWGEWCDHWIVFNIPVDITLLEEGASSNLPEGASHGTVAGGRTTYYGCYPPESGTSTYHFIIYSLDTMLNLNQGATRQQLLAAMEGHILAEAELTGTYSR